MTESAERTWAGKVAVVTGGASGIGLALARRFAAEGMEVAIADRDPSRLEEAECDVLAAGAPCVLTAVTDVAQGGGPAVGDLVACAASAGAGGGDGHAPAGRRTGDQGDLGR